METVILKNIMLPDAVHADIVVAGGVIAKVIEKRDGQDGGGLSGMQADGSCGPAEGYDASL